MILRTSLSAVLRFSASGKSSRIFELIHGFQLFTRFPSSPIHQSCSCSRYGVISRSCSCLTILGEILRLTSSNLSRITPRTNASVAPVSAANKSTALSLYEGRQSEPFAKAACAGTAHVVSSRIIHTISIILSIYLPLFSNASFNV